MVVPPSRLVLPAPALTPPVGAELHQAVIEAIPDVLFVHDVLTQTTVWRNRSVVALLGYSPLEEAGMPRELGAGLIRPEDRLRFDTALARPTDHPGGEPGHVDLKMLHQDRSLRSFSLRTAPLMRSGDGVVRQLLGVLRDTTEQMAVEAALRESETLFHQLADSVDVAFLVRRLDPPEFLYVSPRYEQLFGYDPMKAQTTPNQSLQQIHPEDAERFRLEYWEPCQAGLPAESEYRIVDTLGRTRWVRAKTVPVAQQPGQPRRAASTVEDITASRATEAALRTAREAERAAMMAARDSALTAIRMQNDFAAATSHELKNPTAAVIGFIEEVLENDALTPDDRSCLDIAYRNALRLSRLIDDLLIVGEAEIGSSRMRLAPTPVLPLIRLVLSAFATAAARTDVALVTALGPGALGAGQLSVLADETRLEQALTNLVSNAVKYTRPGGRVTVTADRTVNEVEVTVADTGIGMEAEVLEHIFDRFYRARTAVAHGIEGTGLGLGIARQMIEAQGGRLAVSSQPGQGSTFTLTMPAAPAAPAADGEGVEPPS